MVFEQERIGLDHFSVRWNVIARDDVPIATLPTPICEMARLDDLLFVILHPYPADRNPHFAGANLWALKTNGSVVWKAPDLNAIKGPHYPDIYRGLMLFDAEEPKIIVGQWDDRSFTVLDAMTGHPRPDLRDTWRDLPSKRIAESVGYLQALPLTPPERSQITPIISRSS